jgi:hypothetical protein
MSSSDLDLTGTRLAAELEAAGAAPLSEETRRRLFTALVRDFARRAARDRENGSEDVRPPVDEGVLTSEEVAVTVAAMMRAANVTSFEMAALFDV